MPRIYDHNNHDPLECPSLPLHRTDNPSVQLDNPDKNIVINCSLDYTFLFNNMKLNLASQQSTSSMYQNQEKKAVVLRARIISLEFAHHIFLIELRDRDTVPVLDQRNSNAP